VSLYREAKIRFTIGSFVKAPDRYGDTIGFNGKRKVLIEMLNY
jgi:hypothetical protein